MTALITRKPRSPALAGFSGLVAILEKNRPEFYGRTRARCPQGSGQNARLASASDKIVGGNKSRCKRKPDKMGVILGTDLRLDRVVNIAHGFEAEVE